MTIEAQKYIIRRYRLRCGPSGRMTETGFGLLVLAWGARSRIQRHKRPRQAWRRHGARNCIAEHASFLNSGRIVQRRHSPSSIFVAHAANQAIPDQDGRDWLLILAAAIGMDDQSDRWTACLYRHARETTTRRMPLNGSAAASSPVSRTC